MGKRFGGGDFVITADVGLPPTSEWKGYFKLYAKIERGIQAACWKRKINVQQIEKLAAEVEAHILDQYEKEVASEDIGNLCMEYLRELDQVAFVRFASVYRRFSDIQDFVEELRPILKGQNRQKLK